MADFEEEEVWAMINPKQAPSTSNLKTQNNFSSTSSPSSSAWRCATASRSIPRAATSAAARRSSAPLAIPDWSKILKENPAKDDDDDDDEEEEMVPPHEYLARRLAATQIASFSMCEGVGRTLKGRDLTNLRKAILTKTGFLE